MTVFRKSTLILCFGGLLTASSAFAQSKPKADDKKADGVATKSTEKDDAKEDEDGKKWGVSASLSNRIGQGTFASVEGITETADGAQVIETGGSQGNAFDRVSLGYSLGASYSFDLPSDQSLSVSTGLAWSHWLTQGGGINNSNEIRFQDIGVNVGWSGVTIPGIDTQFTANGGISLPTAQTSRIATKVLGTRVGLGLRKTFFKKLSLGLSASGSKTFHRAEFRVIDADTVGAENVIFREGENRKLGSESLIQIGGVNGEYALVFGFSAGFPIIEKLRGSVSYSVATYWAYNRENDDEFTPDQVDVDGNPIVDVGRGVGQGTSTSISLSYPLFSDWNGISLSASGGVSTGQSPKTADNKSFNFPFWNVNGAAANRSAINLGLSASY